MANIWMYNLASHVEIPNYAPGYYSIHGWIVTQFSHMKKLFVMNIKVKVPRLTALTRICHERERWFKIIIIIIKINRERERERERERGEIDFKERDKPHASLIN